MLTFFRVYAFYHIVFLLIILFTIRLLVLLGYVPIPLLNSDLEAMLVAEKMSATNSSLYANILASVAPLYAGLCSSVISTGRSHAVLQITAMAFAIIQIFYFNFTLANRYAYLEKNYVPGLIYLLFLHLSFDFLTLSSTLVATTFLLFAFGKLIKQLERRDSIGDEIFEAGLYIGLATLFHLPTFVFIFWLSLSMIFFTGASFRQHFLVLIGFILPIFLVGMYFLLTNRLQQFEYCWLSSVQLLDLSKYTLENLEGYLFAFSIPLVFSFFGIYRISRTMRYSNYQNRIQQIMFLWTVLCVPYLLLVPQLVPSQLIVLIPPTAFFTVHFFLNFRKKLLPDLLFMTMFVVVLWIGYLGTKTGTLSQLTNFRVSDKPILTEMKGKKVLIIGEDISEYLHTSPATSYLSWDLAKIDLENPDSYEGVINIFYNFRDDPPAYIIDKKGVMQKIFKRLPTLAQRYQPTNQKGIYKMN